MLKKLRLKFVCINMVIVTVMLGVIFGVLYFMTKSNLEAQSLQLMQSVSEKPIQLGGLTGSSDGVRLPYFMLQIDTRGEIIAVGSGYFDLTDRDLLLTLLREVALRDDESGVLEAYGLRYYRTASPNTQRIIFVDISGEQTTLKNLIRTCLIIGGISFAAFLAISFLLARWAVKPVERAWTQQRQFVSDASHELKTPLTVITTNAELLQNADCETQEYAQLACGILAMSRQMRVLVDHLLELARADNGKSNMTFAHLNLSKLVSDAILPFEPLFFEKELALTTNIEEDITVNGSEQHLQQVVGILLDNAQKYADVPGEVTVCLKKTAHRQCLLSVADIGAPIAPEDLKKIFERFYQIDEARSGNRGYGLGLSIAESIVGEHYGKIWAESENGVNTFFVQLPLE